VRCTHGADRGVDAVGFFDRFTGGAGGSGGVDGRFPPDMPARLARLGRRVVVEGGGPDRASEVAPFVADLEADPDGFVDALVRLGAAHGGWTAFGAQRWLRAVVPRAMSSSRAQRMAAAGVEWAIAQGYGRDLDDWERQLAPGDAVF
jgi:hypothetical protein